MVGKIIRANSRNANRYGKTQRAKKIYGTKTPTDAQIREKESKDRKQRIAEYKARKKNPKAVIPKKTTGKKKPKYTKPDMINPDKEQESYADSLSAARRSNSRNTGRGSGARNTGGAISDPYGALARQPSMKKKDKSYNKLKALIKSMEYIIKDQEYDDKHARSREKLVRAYPHFLETAFDAVRRKGWEKANPKEEEVAFSLGNKSKFGEHFDDNGVYDDSYLDEYDGRSEKFDKAYPNFFETARNAVQRKKWEKAHPKKEEATFSLGNKSFNKIKALIKSMEYIIKNEESTQARVTDVDLGTKIRQRKREGQMRDEPKEVKTGDKYNFESRIGDAAIKSGCRLWKTELNNSFNNTLDVFQELYKDSYSDNKFNEQHGKGKKPRITESGRSGRGSLGGNTEGTDEEISHKMSY